MSKIQVEGGYPLEGSVKIQGAKNSVLPILAATILNGGKNAIKNCPMIKDVTASLEILEELGCNVAYSDNIAEIDSSTVTSYYIPETLMREMRSSIIFLGAIIGRMKKASMSYPGGCELGPRPIDLHLKAFKQLGVRIIEEHGFIHCDVDKIKCDDIHLDFPSVGATENVILLSTLADGVTHIHNAAREPEIVDLQNYLNKMGAKISGAGTSIIRIEGVASLHEVEHTVIPDRIVTASYLISAAMTGGSIEITNVMPNHVTPVISVLEDCGCVISHTENTINIKGSKKIKPIDYLRTLPYPGFPTDAQAPLTSLLSIADGTSMITENMFENRFKHTAELNRMGADIKIDGHVAVIKGVKRLSGAKVSATDLRGAAALVIAGLCAEGVTEVEGLHHLDRGYENFEKGLKNLGAKIERIPD